MNGITVFLRTTEWMRKEFDVVCTRWSNYRDVHAPTNMLGSCKTGLPARLM